MQELIREIIWSAASIVLDEIQLRVRERHEKAVRDREATVAREQAAGKARKASGG